jgi:hypothetical protein
MMTIGIARSFARAAGPRFSIAGAGGAIGASP